MKKRNPDSDDLNEAKDKIEAILKEYNCRIEVDQELDFKVVIWDIDTKKFEFLTHQAM